MPEGEKHGGGGTVLCIAVKVAVCHEIDTKCDFYDFPMPVYALETIHINFLRNF